MSSTKTVRWGGMAAVAGGAMWLVVFTLFASRPSGPGSAPPHRSFEGLSAPLLISAVLIVAGLVALHAHLRGAYGGLGTAGFVLASVGVALLVLVVGGAPFMLSRVGALGLLLGSALMGVATLRASAQLRWGGAALVVGSLALLLLDTESARVWFALPYGAAWTVLGYGLLSSLGPRSVR